MGWEYKILIEPPFDDFNMEDILTLAGFANWELVAVNTKKEPTEYIFKRPINTRALSNLKKATEEKK